METNSEALRCVVSQLLRELIRIREHRIPSRADRLDWTHTKNGRPGFAGVYAFWWRDSATAFLHAMGNRTLHFHGPSGAQLSWKLSLADLKVASNGFIPLYVGKNASDIARRIGLHLKLKTPRTVAAGAVGGICRRMTTSCQVRDRLDRLFPQYADTRPVALHNLALSYVRLDGQQGFIRRFFLEDLAIGLLQPVFNADSER